MNAITGTTTKSNPTVIHNNTLADYNPTNELPSFALGNSISNYFNQLNNRQSTTEIPKTMDLTEDLTTTQVADTVGSSVMPAMAANAITSGLVHANNQQRDTIAQRNPNFDAQHVANMQDARDETVGEIGMGVTTALGATAGLPGVAIGLAGTGLAEALDSVNPNQTLGTSGLMTQDTQ